MVRCDESGLFPSDLQRLAKPPKSALLWVGEGREELIVFVTCRHVGMMLAMLIMLGLLISSFSPCEILVFPMVLPFGYPWCCCLFYCFD